MKETKETLEIGATLALCPLFGGWEHWEALVHLEEVAWDDQTQGWRRLSNSELSKCVFAVSGSDYHIKQCKSLELVELLGFDRHPHGEWAIETEYERRVRLHTAGAAIARMRRYEKRMDAFREKFGAPAGLDGLLMRAVQAVRPVAVRFGHEHEKGRDFSRQWEATKACDLGYKLHRMSAEFRERINAKRDNLFLWTEVDQAEVEAVKAGAL